jgi:hypothetical protein
MGSGKTCYRQQSSTRLEFAMHPAQLVCVFVFLAGLIAVCLIQEIVRSQVINRLEMGDRVSWRTFREAADWFGQGGLWRLHKEHFPASSLRFWFVASVALMLLAFGFGSVLQAYGVR